jgi:hypothetical protein
VAPNSSVAIEGMDDLYAIFVGTIGLGTPPQYVELLLDTGSTDLAVVSEDYCVSCVTSSGSDQAATFPSCPAMSACTAPSTYSPNNSSTSSHYCSPDAPAVNSGQCYVIDTYLSGQAWLGFEYLDVVAFGQVSAPAPFAVIAEEWGAFTTAANSGIFGLGMKQASSIGELSPLTRLLKHNNLTDTFSMCLGDNPDHEEGYEAGYMLLGLNGSGELQRVMSTSGCACSGVLGVAFEMLTSLQ